MITIGMLDEGRSYAQPYGFNEAVRLAAREIPGLAWDRESKAWVGWPDAVEAFARLVEENDISAAQGDITGPEEPNEVVGDGLRQYQVEGVKFLVANAPLGGVLLGDDTGVGKTAQAIRAARTIVERDPNAGSKIIVVCPAVLKGVWVSEIEKWWPGIDVLTLQGTAPKKHMLRGAYVDSIVILNYDIVYAWVDWLEALKPRIVIFDEAHYLQNDQSRRSRACQVIAEAASARIALSATPITSKPRNLWNVVDTLCPGRFGKTPWHGYLQRYCDAHQETVAQDTTVWVTDGSSNEEELANRLRWIMLRRSKADVMTELPERTRQVIDVQVSKKSIIPIWNDGSKGKMALSQALNAAGLGKVAAAVELATSKIAEGHSVILFSHLRDTAKRIAAGLGKAKIETHLMTGEESATIRASKIKALENVQSPVAVSATIDAVGVGISFAFANIAIFVDLDYVPAKLLQAEGRLFRHGQKRAVVIYYLIATGTADEYVKEKVIKRLDLYEKIIGKASEAKGLKDDIVKFDKMSEEDVLADLRKAVLKGEMEDI